MVLKKHLGVGFKRKEKHLCVQEWNLLGTRRGKGICCMINSIDKTSNHQMLVARHSDRFQSQTLYILGGKYVNVKKIFLFCIRISTNTLNGILSKD